MKRWQAQLPVAPLLLLAVGASWGLGLAVTHIFYPYSVDFGEGLTLTGALRLAEGGIGGGYAYSSYYNAPILDYPPLYPLLVAGLHKLGLPLLIAGRGLTLAACLACGGLLALLVRREGAAGWLQLCCVVAPLGGYPFTTWAGVGRIDSLGLALSLSGFYLATTHAAERSAELQTRNPQSAIRDLQASIAALCFALAIFTKQSMVAAPAAVVLAGLTLPGLRRRALGLAGLTAGLLAAMLAAMQAATGGEYINVITAERNAIFSFKRTLTNYATFATLFVPLILLAAVGWWSLRGTNKSSLYTPAGGLRAIFLYWPLAWLLAGLIGKPGSADYYLMELLIATLLLAVIGYLRLERMGGLPAAPTNGLPTDFNADMSANKRRIRRWLVAIFTLALLVQAGGLIGVAAVEPGIQLRGMEREPVARQVVAALRAAGKAEVFCDVPGLLLVAGRADQVYDRYVLRQLSGARLRDDSAEVADFRRGRWAVVVLSFDPFADVPGGDWDEGSWPPGTLAAIRNGYRLDAVARRADRAAQYWVLRPK